MPAGTCRARSTNPAVHQRAARAQLGSSSTHTRALRPPPRGLVIRSAKPSGFIAGADIKEFPSSRTSTQARSDDARRPAHVRRARGPALPHGGASSTASRSAAAWNWRWPAAIAWASTSDKLSLGLPEVQLGIHPGFGGTVRAVRLAGVRAGHGDDAHRQDPARRPGNARRLLRPAGVPRGRRSRGARAHRAPAEAASRPACSTACCPGRWCAAWCASTLVAPGARQGAARTLSRALRHHRLVVEVRRARRTAPTRPRRAPSPR